MRRGVIVAYSSLVTAGHQLIEDNTLIHIRIMQTMRTTAVVMSQSWLGWVLTHSTEPESSERPLALSSRVGVNLSGGNGCWLMCLLWAKFTWLTWVCTYKYTVSILMSDIFDYREPITCTLCAEAPEWRLARKRDRNALFEHQWWGLRLLHRVHDQFSRGTYKRKYKKVGTVKKS